MIWGNFGSVEMSFFIKSKQEIILNTAMPFTSTTFLAKPMPVKGKISVIASAKEKMIF